MIFSRGRGSGGRHKRAEGDPGRSPHGDDTGDTGQPAEGTGGRTGGPAAGHGPYDVSEAPGGDRLDLGSLHIPAVEGVEIRVQANPDGSIGQIVLVHGESALQLGVFAAPRSTGIWDEVRAEIRASLTSDGARSDEVSGEYGTELRARIRTPEGPAEVRFIGVDGPRWMLRAVYQGPAATDPSAAGPLADCLHNLVVDRGREAMPVREALPLRLPREVADQQAQQARAQQAQAGAAQAGQPQRSGQVQGRQAGQAPAGDGGVAQTPNGSSAQTGRRGSSSRTRRPR